MKSLFNDFVRAGIDGQDIALSFSKRGVKLKDAVLLLRSKRHVVK